MNTIDIAATTNFTNFTAAVVKAAATAALKAEGWPLLKLQERLEKGIPSAREDWKGAYQGLKQLLELIEVVQSEVPYGDTSGRRPEDSNVYYKDGWDERYALKAALKMIGIEEEFKKVLPDGQGRYEPLHPIDVVARCMMLEYLPVEWVGYHALILERITLYTGIRGGAQRADCDWPWKGPREALEWAERLRKEKSREGSWLLYEGEVNKPFVDGMVVSDKKQWRNQPGSPGTRNRVVWHHDIVELTDPKTGAPVYSVTKGAPRAHEIHPILVNNQVHKVEFYVGDLIKVAAGDLKVLRNGEEVPLIPYQGFGYSDTYQNFRGVEHITLERLEAAWLKA